MPDWFGHIVVRQKVFRRPSKARFPLASENFRMGHAQSGKTNKARQKDILPSVHIWNSNISTSEKFSYSETNQTFSLSHVDISRWLKYFSQTGRPTASSGRREERHQYFLKTRIIELETSFRLRQFFAATLRKWRLIFPPKYFSLTKNSVSDSRNVWMEIKFNVQLVD